MTVYGLHMCDLVVMKSHPNHSGGSRADLAGPFFLVQSVSLEPGSDDQHPDECQHTATGPSDAIVAADREQSLLRMPLG